MRRGLGGIYRRGEIWWIHYSREGKLHQESSRSTDPEAAKSLLHRRLGDIGANRVSGGPVTLEGLRDLLLDDYDTQGRRSGKRVRECFAHLKAAFGGERAETISSPRLLGYVSARKEAGASPATIRQELAYLRRSMKLAVLAGKLGVVPVFPTIKVQNVRDVFVEEDVFPRIVEHLEEPVIRRLVTFLFWTGWRKDDAKGLLWSQVDMKRKSIRLGVGLTKNSAGRILPYGKNPELVKIINAQWKDSQAYPHVTHVFHRGGKKIGLFRKQWLTACKAAGVPEQWVHDFRRTAARRYVRAQVYERVAMELLGMKTTSIFHRYLIQNERDMENAMAQTVKVTVKDRGRGQPPKVGKKTGRSR